MLVDASVPGSDDWWLIRLCNELGEGLPRMGKLTKYRDGDALIPDNMPNGARESYMRFVRRARLHVVETIRDARTNRQKVIGFRTAATGDDAGDIAAWKMWKQSNMAVQSRQFFNDTADFGRAYLLTRPDEFNEPLIQARNGWDTHATPDASRKWLSRYAVTVSYDAVSQQEIVVLYGQGWYRIAVRRTAIPTLPQDGTVWVVNSDWEWATDRIRTPYTNRCLIVANSTVDGFGVYEKHLDTVDRINELTLNGLSLIVMQAFRQRAIKGDLPEYYPNDHPLAGQKVDYNALFEAGPAALWFIPESAEIWESAATDPTPIYGARDKEQRALAAHTSTPLYVFLGDAENQSATGAELAREPLIFAVDAMNESAEFTLVNAMATGFGIQGDTTRADVLELEPMFAKTSQSSLMERGESAAKFKAGGATQRWIDENVLEMTPDQRRQAVDDRVEEALTAAIAAEAGSGNQSGSKPTSS